MITLGGHKNSDISSLSLISNNTIIASGDSDGLIKLWDFVKVTDAVTKNKLLWDYFDSESDPDSAIIMEVCCDKRILYIDNFEVKENCLDFEGNLREMKQGFLVLADNGEISEFLLDP